MKYFKNLLVILILVSSISSCSSDDSKSDSSQSFSLVGEWSNYKRSRIAPNVVDSKAVVALCGATGATFDCDTAIIYYSNGTGKTTSDEANFTYSYENGVRFFNGYKSEITVISPIEYTHLVKATQNGIYYETTYYYKKK